MFVKNQSYSVYIHIPFCKNKCAYCNFVSFTDKNSLIKLYIDELKNELKTTLSKLTAPKLKTIYIGGGTPSLLPINKIAKIVEELSANAIVSKDIEFTIEVNPGTVDKEYLSSLRSMGINRLSMGVQSFNDNILKRINRQHNSEEAVKCIQWAKEAGFNNISIDLIYGLPEQTLDNWSETLERAVSLDVNHISAYGLKIEAGTEFYKNPPKCLPDEDLNADLYVKTIEFLETKGFFQYEISNFARKGFESKHNLTYWQNQNYFGFGIASHGYIDDKRYSNTSDLNVYLSNENKKEEERFVSNQEQIEEAIFLGLRLNKGINLVEFEAEYKVDLLKSHEKIIQKYCKNGFMILDDNFLKLTTEGFLLSNCILADFID